MSAMGNYVVEVEEFIYELMTSGQNNAEIREAVKEKYGHLGLGILDNVESEVE